MDGRGLRALICTLLVVGCVVAAVPLASATGAADAGTSATADGPVAQQQEPEMNASVLQDADEVSIGIEVDGDGSAAVTVDYQYHLDDENASVDDWDALEENVSANREAFVDSQADSWGELVADGENATDREDMALRNPGVETDTSQSGSVGDIGHVEFSFDWESFAYVELNRIEVEGGELTGLTLGDDDELAISWPEGYALDDGDVEPEPDSQDDESVTWDGEETDFDDDEPSLEVMDNGDEDEQEPATESDPETTVPWPLVTVVLALLVTVGGAGWWLRGRNGDEAATQSPDGGADPAADRAGSDGPPPELLSNEERVLRLLEEHGGRIKQQDVVTELDWTEAKTSQVVGGLREDDRIEVFRIGRENVLALPEEDDR